MKKYPINDLYFILFRTVQCDLHLDLDCTNYLLYDFPDEIDIEIYETLHCDGNIEQTYDHERLKKAFCIYLDGYKRKILLFCILPMSTFQES